MATKAFISHRGRDHRLAESVAQRLVDSGFTDRAVLVPPNRLSEANELLLPFEYFELMEFIVDEMHDCTHFVALDRGDYWQSYWTQAEVGHWRRLHRRPVVHRVAAGPGADLVLDDGTELDPLPKGESSLKSRISFIASRRAQNNTRGATFTGRYAKSCFLVPCGSCEKHFLATQKVVCSAVGSAIYCPGCGAPLRIKEMSRKGTFHRRPVVLADGIGPISPVDERILVELLVLDDLPTGVDLVKLPDEKLAGVAVWGALNDKK